MGYRTGALLWGNTGSNNIWIVVDGGTRSIALVFEGKNKLYSNDYSLTKKDYIKLTSTLTELTDLEQNALISQYGPLPGWVTQIIAIGVTPVSLPAVSLPLGVVAKVEAALGVCLTAKPSSVILRRDDEKCSVTGGDHSYTPYTGLIECFDYCTNCDKKRNFSM